MAIPSPDAALIAAADRILASVQGRGIPLPAALATPLPGPCIGALGVALTLPGIGQWPFAPVWVVIAAVFAEVARRQAASLRSDAENWSPRLHARYLALAVAHRAIGRTARSILLFLILMTALLAAAGLSIGGPAMPLALNVLAYLTLALGFAMVQYARCALPREPGSARVADVRDAHAA